MSGPGDEPEAGLPGPGDEPEAGLPGPGGEPEAGLPGIPPMRIPHTSQKSSLAESCPLGHTAIAASWVRYACSPCDVRYFLARTVLVDLVSRAISSASSTCFFSRTVPVSTSMTSTTLASSLAVSSLPD